MEPTTRYTWQALRTAADAWQFCPNTISPSALRDGCYSWLSTAERAQCEMFQTERLRHDYLAARALCRATLSRYAGVEPAAWSFGTTSHGKPTILEPAEFASLRFNMTHTSGLVICLVSRAGDVGVDAEETSRTVDVAQVARHFLSRREQTCLESLPSHQRGARFFEQWVLREAYLKGIGKGVAASPERFTIEFGENGRPLPIGTWRFVSYQPGETHVAAAAVHQRRGPVPVSVRWLKTDDPFLRRTPRLCWEAEAV